MYIWELGETIGTIAWVVHLNKFTYSIR